MTTSDSDSQTDLPLLPSQRHLFDIPDDIAYFNCAYMSPLMKAVADAGANGLKGKIQPWTTKPADFFTETAKARNLFAKLIGADAADIAIIPAVSYGISVAATNLPAERGQTILILQDQFPSNVYGWREKAKETGAEIVTLPRPERLDASWTEQIIAAISEQTAIVALPHCHWTDGRVLDLKAIGAACRDKGAALALDLTQSLGALPFSAAEVQPDFAIAATYKWLLGPYSLGFMYVAPKWQNGRPLEHNWISRKGSENFSGLIDYTEDIKPGAQRFDVGEPSNFQLMPQATAAMAQILDWGVDAISETLAARTTSIASRTTELGLSAPAADLRAPHYLGLNSARGVPDDLVEQLSAQNVFISKRGSTLRITPHLYNTDTDEDRFVKALQSAL